MNSPIYVRQRWPDILGFDGICRASANHGSLFWSWVFQIHHFSLFSPKGRDNEKGSCSSRSGPSFTFHSTPVKGRPGKPGRPCWNHPYPGTWPRGCPTAHVRRHFRADILLAAGPSGNPVVSPGRHHASPAMESTVRGWKKQPCWHWSWMTWSTSRVWRSWCSRWWRGDVRAALTYCVLPTLTHWVLPAKVISAQLPCPKHNAFFLPGKWHRRRPTQKDKA